MPTYFRFPNNAADMFSGVFVCDNSNERAPLLAQSTASHAREARDGESTTW